MGIKHSICLVGLAVGVTMPAAALQDERQRGSVSARWTSPGWYLFEYRGGSEADLLRGGPYADAAKCWTARRSMQPGAPAAHPELDVMTCRELKQAP